MESERASIGGCLCEAVRLAWDEPTLFCAHCHCRWCRRAHGAAFVTWFGVPTAAFRVTTGADVLRWYASSAHSERGFCTVCGTTMLFRSSLAPGEVHIALACADGEIDRAPAAHVFYDAHVAWCAVTTELPQLDREHAALAKYQAIGPNPRRG